MKNHIYKILLAPFVVLCLLYPVFSFAQGLVMLFPSNELLSNLNKKTYTSEVNYFKDLNQATVKKIKAFATQPKKKNNFGNASTSDSQSGFSGGSEGGSGDGGGSSSGDGSTSGQSGGSTSGDSTSLMSQHMNALQNNGVQTQTGGSQSSDPGGSQATAKPDPDAEDKKETPSSYNGKCGGYSTDAEMRQILASAGISVNSPKPKTSLEQMPSFVAIFLKKIKDDCKCSVIVTGGTEPGHKTHGPRIAIFDLRQQEPFNSYVKSKGQNIDGVRFVWEGNSGRITAHWHVIANGYKCGK